MDLNICFSVKKLNICEILGFFSKENNRGILLFCVGGRGVDLMRKSSPKRGPGGKCATGQLKGVCFSGNGHFPRKKKQIKSYFFTPD